MITMKSFFNYSFGLFAIVSEICAIRKPGCNGFSKCGILKIKQPALLGRNVTLTFTPDSYDPNANLEWQYAHEGVSWLTCPLTYKFTQYYEDESYHMILTDSLSGIDEVHYRIHYYNESMHCWMEAGKVKLNDNPYNSCGFVHLKNELILEHETVKLEYYPSKEVMKKPGNFMRRWTYIYGGHTLDIQLKDSSYNEKKKDSGIYELIFSMDNKEMQGEIGVYCGGDAGYTNIVSLFMQDSRTPAQETHITKGTTPYGVPVTKDSRTPAQETHITKGKSEKSEGVVLILWPVISALAVGILIGAICTWFILNRQDKIKGSEMRNNLQSTVSQDSELTGATSTLNSYELLQDRTDSENREAYDSLNGPENQSHPPPTVFQEELTRATSTLNTYEQLQNRTITENLEAYDSLDANSRPAPNSQSQYESLEQGEKTSHTYTDLKQSR